MNREMKYLCVGGAAERQGVEESSLPMKSFHPVWIFLALEYHQHQGSGATWQGYKNANERGKGGVKIFENLHVAAVEKLGQSLVRFCYFYMHHHRLLFPSRPQAIARPNFAFFSP